MDSNNLTIVKLESVCIIALTNVSIMLKSFYWPFTIMWIGVIKDIEKEEKP